MKDGVNRQTMDPEEAPARLDKSQLDGILKERQELLDQLDQEEQKHDTQVEDLAKLLVLKEQRAGLNLIAIPLLILSGVAVGFVLVWAEDILVPFVISVFFTYLLRPVVDFLSRPLVCTIGVPNRLRFWNMNSENPSLSQGAPAGISANAGGKTMYEDLELANLLNQKQRKGSKPSNARFGRIGCGQGEGIQVPRWLAILLSMLLVVALFVGLVVLVMDAMQSFEQESLSAYEDRTVELANLALRWLKRNFNVDGTYMVDQIKNEFQLVQITKSLLIVLMNAVAYTFIVMLFVLYMLFEGAVQGPMNEPDELEADRAIRDVRRQIDTQIQIYLVTKTLISFVVGGLTYLVLGPLLHVKMAHLFGVITFLMNYVPNVGAVVATLLPLPIVLLDTNQNGVTVVLTFLLPTMIHTIVGNIIEPIFFGQQMELHPVVVLLSLSFWFSLWGVPGAILSVPITAVIRIIVSNIDHPYARFTKNILEGKLRWSVKSQT